MGNNESHQISLVLDLASLLLTSFYPSFMKFLNLYLDNETKIRNIYIYIYLNISNVFHKH